MNLSIVFPVFPPTIDGIGDHTANLAKALVSHATITVLTGPEPHLSQPGINVESIFSADARVSAAKLERALIQNSPDWILIQYNPFSYGKWGYNPYIPSAIARIASKTKSRIAVMVHEPLVPAENIKFKIMRLWQKWQLDTLMSAADVTFFSISEWTTEYSRRYPTKEIIHLPIGSNIPVVTDDSNRIRTNLGIDSDDVLLGLFGSGHPNRLFPFIHHAVSSLRKRGHKAPLLYVGGSSDKLSAVFGNTNYINGGKLPAEDVSKHLQAMDVYVCPFGKGVSARRGSFMAGIQHGLPAVTTFGSQTDSFFREYNATAFLASEDDSVEEFVTNVELLYTDSELRQSISEGGKKMYGERFEWDMIANTAYRAMTSFDERNKI